MLDPHAEGSPLCCLRKDITERLESIEKKVTEQIIRKDVISKTTQKGFAFEDTLESFLIQISHPFGGTQLREQARKKGNSHA